MRQARHLMHKALRPQLSCAMQRKTMMARRMGTWKLGRKKSRRA
jgi:hypothetical protein